MIHHAQGYARLFFYLTIRYLSENSFTYPIGQYLYAKGTLENALRDVYCIL